MRVNIKYFSKQDRILITNINLARSVVISVLEI